MPSTLYQSVKKSVIEFAELRKKNQKVEDKLIFRWKLITLGLSIVFIVLVGGFSQILKGVNNLPNVIVDKSYILPLLQSVNDNSVPAVQQANNLINGISASLQDTEEEYLYNRASLVFNYLNTGANIDISAFSTSITNKNHLVFIVSTNEVPTPKSKFAFFGFAGYSDHSGTTNISDASESKYSTFFNLDASKVLQYDSGCPIYRRDANSFILFQSFSLNSDGSTVVGLQSSNFGCIKATDQLTANAEIGLLTGVDLSAQNLVPITVQSLQVFQLYLDSSQ